MSSLSLKTEDGRTLNSIIDDIFYDVPDLLTELKGNLEFVHGPTAALGSGDEPITALNINFPSLTKEMLDELRPLFKILARLAEVQSGQKITATLTISNGEDVEIYEI